MSRKTLLPLGLIVLVAADLVLALDDHWTTVLAGVALWGIHMGMTQGLLATMVADTAPADLRGTAFGFFSLVSGLAMLIASVVQGCPGTRSAPRSRSMRGPHGIARPVQEILNCQLTRTHKHAHQDCQRHPPESMRAWGGAPTWGGMP